LKTDFFYKSPVLFPSLNPSGGTAVKIKKTSGIFESVSAYYSFVKIIPPDAGSQELLSCFAMKLAGFIINFFGDKKYALSKENSLPESFYRKCLTAAKNEEAIAAIDDNLLISMKQMMHMLRAAGIARIKNGKTFMEYSGGVSASLYFQILDAFWNKLNWPNIFPSDPEAAGNLMNDRMIMIDIMAHNGRMDINTLANEFFDLTGFAAPNDIHAISFIDFYMLFWLKNFDIINYYDIDGKISVELTAAGKKLSPFANK
jgi:hypothetical protein